MHRWPTINMAMYFVHLLILNYATHSAFSCCFTPYRPSLPILSLGWTLFKLQYIKKRFYRIVTTRSKSHEHNQSMTKEQPALFTLPLETLTERRRRWAYLLRAQHYYPVISEILDDELPKYNNSIVLDATDRISHMRECALILASAPSVFTAAVEGNLVNHIQTNADLQAEYAVIQERAHLQPSIYIHLLTDKHGVAPTSRQYLVIRDMVQDYISQDPPSQHAAHIDSIISPMTWPSASKQEYRKYLETCTTRRSPRRVATFQRFCTGIDSRCLATPPHLHDTPFPFPPTECGYSKHSPTRLAQHRAHQSSNYIMNLVEDICTHLHRSCHLLFPQHFTMHPFIIYLIFHPAQAAIAEIFCSALLQAWVDDGGGFNAYPAGRSVASAARVGRREWEGGGRWVREVSGLVGRMRFLTARAEEWREALRWEEREVGDEVVEAELGESDTKSQSESEITEVNQKGQM